MFIKPNPPLYNLPSYYSDCETYEEQLQWLLNQLNTLAQMVANVTRSVNNYTDEEIEKLQTKVTEELKNMEKFVTESIEKFRERYEKDFEEMLVNVGKLSKDLEEKYNYLILYINEEIKKVRADLIVLETKLNHNIETASKSTLEQANIYTNIIKQNLQAKILEVNQRIDTIAKEFPLVYNPTLGSSTDFQTTINDLYTYLRSHGVTAENFDFMKITAEQFDLLLEKALRFDIDFGSYALKKTDYIFNPFSGKKEQIKDVVYAIADAININGKTASEIDGAEKTASEIDNVNIDAYKFDWLKNLANLDDEYANKKLETMEKIPIETSGVFLFHRSFETPKNISGVLVKGHYGKGGQKYNFEKRLTTEDLKSGNVANMQSLEFSLVQNEVVTISTRKILLSATFDSENPKSFTILSGLLQPTSTYVKDSDGEHFYTDSDGEEYSLVVTSVEIISPSETIKEIN